MKYQKPLCDCGEELLYEVDKVITFVRYKITKNGQIFANPIERHSLKQAENFNYGRFFCEKCKNTYEYDYDYTINKLVRGDKMY